MREVLLHLDGARADGALLPHAPLHFQVARGDFALVEAPGRRRGAAFADLCMGLVPLIAGRAGFMGRDWGTLPTVFADALRGHVGRLFYLPLRPDTPDVAARVLLARLHHTRTPEAVLRAEAAALAVRFGLPGLPVGPARLMQEQDLLRASCVRAFLGQPELLILELPSSAQQDALLDALLELGAEARGRGAGVVWLAGTGPALRKAHVRPTQRLRLGDGGLLPARPAVAGA